MWGGGVGGAKRQSVILTWAEGCSLSPGPLERSENWLALHPPPWIQTKVWREGRLCSLRLPTVLYRCRLFSSLKRLVGTYRWVVARIRGASRLYSWNLYPRSIGSAVVQHPCQILAIPDFSRKIKITHYRSHCSTCIILLVIIFLGHK